MTELKIDDPAFEAQVRALGDAAATRMPPNDRGRHVAFLGGSGAFAANAAEAYPALIGGSLGIPVRLIGMPGAGPDHFLGDPALTTGLAGAALWVVEVMCPSAISNRMFTVPARRSDRIAGVSDLLRGIFPEVDFATFRDVPAMLECLCATDEHRYRLVVNEMRNAWISRTGRLLEQADVPTILFWSAQPALDGVQVVDWPMVETVATAACSVVVRADRRSAHCAGSAAPPLSPPLSPPSGATIAGEAGNKGPAWHAMAAAMLEPEITRILAALPGPAPGAGG